MATKGYILDNEGTSSSTTRYDDMLGDVSTSPTGASQWLTAQIGTTGFFINWLQSGQNDFTQQKLQMSHMKALGTALKSLHVHYLLSTSPSAGQTVNLNWAYTWVKMNTAVPAIGSWASNTHTITFTGSEAANTHYVESIVTNVAAPANETYSSIFFIKITRESQGGGADSYGGNFGLLYLDGHIQKNRLGSVNESSD